MKQVNLSLKCILRSRSEASIQLDSPGDAVLITRGRPRWLVLKCPCGCEDEIPINLDERAGKAWRIFNSKENEVSIYPSIWRETGCLSHFIIHNDKILLFTYGESRIGSTGRTRDVRLIARRVIDVLELNSWTHYVQVADELDENPWDVLDACLHLRNQRVVQQGHGELISSFRRQSDVDRA